jgi:hypothetical protein
MSSTSVRVHADASPGAVELAVAYRMEGALLALGALIPSVLVKEARFSGALESLAHEYLVPVFASPHAFLRSKAVWLAGQYACELEFPAEGAEGKRRGQGTLFDRLFDLVLACMNDPCAPPHA